MLRIQSILHPTDFSDSAEAALPYALDLARRHEATLHILHVTPAFGDDPLRGALDAQIDEDAFYRDLRDRMDRRMQDLLAGHDTTGVAIKRVHSRGVAAGEVIIAYAETEAVDVVVLGTHGWRGLRRLLLGSVAQDVLHHAKCPVVTVRTGRDVPLPVRRLLVPIDFSVHSLNALTCAKHLASAYGAALDVLHVIDPVMTEALQRAGWVNRTDTERTVRAQAEEKLAWLSGEVEGPGPVALTQHLRVGYPPEEIAALAQERGTDLIVIATHGLRGLDRFPMGSVAASVLRAAPCPVFLTRPFGRSLLPPPPDARAATTRAKPPVPSLRVLPS